jgi:hypothetical protein
MHSLYFFVFFFVLFYTFNNIYADEQSKQKIKKDPRDFTDNDVDKLFEQWEVIFIFLDKLNNSLIDIGK